jgi:hypothetical protein
VRTALTGSALGSLIALSVLLRGLFPTIVIPPAASRRAPIAAPSSVNPMTEDRVGDGPWKAAQRYFAGWGPTGCGNPSEGPRTGVWCIPESTPSSPVRTRAVIAIAPDPIRTHMALTFDRTLEGFQLAAQDAGYVIDRYWLPWSIEGTMPAGSDSSKASSQQDPHDQAERERRAGEPGLLLLRRDRGPSQSLDLLFVFLVADTPTGGIDGNQLKNAVKYIAEVCGTPCTSVDPIRVVGPSFSGSVASLRRLAEAIGGHFTAYSGAVSSQDILSAPDLQPLPPGDRQARSLTLRTFVHDTDSAIDMLVKALANTRAVGYDRSVACDEPEIAILSEGATEYGAVARKPDSCVETFVFPREISSLRNASSAAAAAAPQQSSAVSGRQLPLNLTDPTNSSDAPPDFSRGQAPLSKEAVLMNIAAELKRTRFRYVGVVASNVLDDLFLAEFLRAASPDARLFMVSADLMFEREFDNVPYVGMLSITTYPLIHRSLAWTDGDNAPTLHLPFADEYSQGEYNATLQTLSELEQLTLPLSQTRPPGPHAQEKGLPSTFPLWMTVVGPGGYWPVRLLDGDANGVELSLKASDLSGAWRVLLLLICGLAALHSVVLLTAQPLATRFRDFAIMAGAPRQRMFFIQLSCAVCVMALGFLLLPALRYAPSGWLQAVGWLQRLGITVTAIVIATALLLEVLYYRRWKWLQETAAGSDDLKLRALISQILMCAGIWIGAIAVLLLWWRLLGPEENAASHYGFFFAYRATHPVAGVSPVPPLLALLVAMYIWTCFEIWRLRFNEDLRPRLVASSQADGGTTRPRPGELTEKNIAIAVSRYSLGAPYIGSFVAVFAVWLAFFHPENPFELFERRTFGLVYELLFCLVVALMLAAGLRMMQIWTNLRRLLLELEGRPIRFAFSRFKALTWSFWRLGGEEIDRAVLSRAFEALTRLNAGLDPRESGAPDLAHFKNRISTWHVAIQEIRKTSEKERSDLIEKLHEDVAAAKAMLSSADTNVFLKSAVDDVAAALDTNLDVMGSRIEAAMMVIQLLEKSSAALHGVGPLIAAWRKVMDRRPFLAVVEAIREYSSKDSTSRGELSVALYNDVQVALRKWQEDLATIVGEAWNVLESRWRREASRLVDYERREALERDNKDDDTDVAWKQLRSLEEFVALQYLGFIRLALSHLRHVMIFVAASFTLILISLNIYSFEPHQSLIWSFTLIFIVTGFMVVSVLAQMHRDPILSRVTGTTGKALDVHFYLRLVAFGALPLLTLLATHFPSIGQYLVSFLQPSLEALK